VSKSRRTSGRAEAQKTADRLLFDLILRGYKSLCKQVDENMKPGDWLKMIELHRKVSPDKSAQKELWESLEKIRREILAGKKVEVQARDGKDERAGSKK